MVAVALWALAQEASTCARCHEREARLEAASVHARGAACVDCHGGNPKEADRERAHGPPLLRAAVPAACARCHSDVRRMNPTGLPTDQHAQYVTSKHGLAQAAGKATAAVCSDCHGAHGIRPARDPASPVFPRNVPATCGKCHAEAATVAPYRDGVHGELLLKRGDLSAPTCATCHGHHGAAPPGFAEVSRVCGKCHVRQRDHFEQSPHAFYAKDGNFQGCVVCHSNHRIVTSPAEIGRRCGPCHEAADPETGKYRALASLLEESRKGFARVSERLARRVRAGGAADEEAFLLDQARTSLLQLPVVQHTLKEDLVRQVERPLEAVLVEIDRRLDGRERSERIRRLSLVPIWGFLVAMAALFWAKRRRLESSKGAESRG